MLKKIDEKISRKISESLTARGNVTADRPLVKRLISEKRKLHAFERMHAEEHQRTKLFLRPHIRVYESRTNSRRAMLYVWNQLEFVSLRETRQCNYHCSWQSQLMRQTATHYVARVHLGATLQNSILWGKIFSLYSLELLRRIKCFNKCIFRKCEIYFSLNNALRYVYYRVSVMRINLIYIFSYYRIVDKIFRHVSLYISLLINTNFYHLFFLLIQLYKIFLYQKSFSMYILFCYILPKNILNKLNISSTDVHIPNRYTFACDWIITY